MRLVELEEPETSIKNVLRPGEPGLRQDRRENTGARRLAGLHPLGQHSVQNALAIAGGMAVGDAQGGQHLLRREAISLPAAAVAPNTPIAAVRCQPRSSVLASGCGTKYQVPVQPPSGHLAQ